MNDLVVLKALTGVRLSSAGRHEEAIRWLAPELIGLKSLISQQVRLDVGAPEGVLGDLVRGWGHYYHANYAKAFSEFSKAEHADVPWLKAFAMLGKGKVCTDLGFFADAVRWCSDASCVARQFEHDDLVAAAQGARGEILLRAGQPRLAMEAYTLDMALLPASDRFRGRVMCYQAHAYRRLGAYSAAKLAYRTSAKQPGEQTAPYAFAGLAMLGAETGEIGLIDEAIRYIESLSDESRIHSSVGWIYVAKSRSAQRQGEDPLVWCESATRYFPAEHIYEHQWLANWTASFGDQVESTPSVDESLRNYRPNRPGGQRIPGYQFDSETIDASLFNIGLANLEWSTDVESLWDQRLFFVF